MEIAIIFIFSALGVISFIYNDVRIENLEKQVEHLELKDNMISDYIGRNKLIDTYLKKHSH